MSNLPPSPWKEFLQALDSKLTEERTLTGSLSQISWTLANAPTEIYKPTIESLPMSLADLDYGEIMGVCGR